MSYDLTYVTAAHMLAVLAFHEGQWVTSGTMAESVQTNPGLVRRILSKLATAGLVETKPGREGGARLARAAESINLADVFDAVVENPVLRTSTRAPNPVCTVSRGIGGALQGAFGDAEAAMRDELRKTSLEQVMSKI